MRRLTLFELHEQPFYPKLWREMFQDGLSMAAVKLRIYAAVAEAFSRFLSQTRADRVLDLCSGAAEPILQLRESLGPPLEEPDKVKFVLSDLFPPVERFRRLAATHPEAIEFYSEPVNALHPPDGAPRVRTLFSAFHHFPPGKAREILRDAALHADGIAIFETTERRWSHILQCLLLFFPAVVICGFSLRPYRLSHLLWGALIPVVPLTAVWDGVVSCLRTYSVIELEEMTRSIESPDFEWEAGALPMPGSSLRVTYLFGRRIEAEVARAGAA